MQNLKMNIYLNFFFALLMLVSKASFAQQINIIQKPIIFDSLRTKLSLTYLKEHYKLDQQQPTIKPIMIVLHYTEINTLQATYNTFNTSVLPNARAEISGASKLNVSSHYLIDRDGSIYQLLPDTVFARHVIGLNYCAIGIENFGGSNYPLTESQLLANENLVRYLSSKYPIQYLIDHYEYLQFKNTPLWLETDANYSTVKADPGKAFMTAIRAKLADLKLKPAPNSN